MQMSSLWSVKPEFRLKVGLLSLTFFFLTATQALWRTLKVSVFAKIVSAAAAPDAKIYSRAVKMIELGADIDEIMRECEIPKAEADLLLSLHQKS